MRIKTFSLLILALCLPFVGCESLSDRPEGETTLTDLAFDFGVKLATYKALQQNPEYIDLANAVADILDGKGAEAVTGDLLNYVKETLIPGTIDTPADQLIAAEVVDSFYLLFKPQIDELAARAQLPILAQNIRAGIVYATLNPDS